MKKRIGEKIKHLRQERLMTQSELSGDKITRSMLSLIEHGNSEPSLSSLSYLAERLHVSPAYLLATASEDDMYRRAAQIGDIRIAYASGEYRICLDLCRAVELPDDDELNLLAAECSIALAVEEISHGNLHSVTDHLDDAVEYADRTRYGTAHVYASAAVLARYLGRFSDTFYFDAETLLSEKGVSPDAAAGEPFSLYALLLFRLEAASSETSAWRRENEAALGALKRKEPLLALHIEELLLMREGNATAALSVISEIFGSYGSIPVPILYELFRDKEICAKESGDFKAAYESASAKHELLSRILSEP